MAALCPNIPALLEAHYGVPAAGGVLVAINTRLCARDRLHPRALGLALPVRGRRARGAGRASRLAGVEVVRVDDTGAAGDPYEQFLAGGRSGRRALASLDEEEPISINYTSGTTGQPKGVMYTLPRRVPERAWRGHRGRAGLRPVYLWTLPMFHCNGWCFPWAVTAAGGTHVCLRQVDPTLIWELIERRGRSRTTTARPPCRRRSSTIPNAARLERPVTALVAGAPPSPTLLARLEELNIRPVHVYGLTETYGPHTVCALERRTGTRCRPRSGAPAGPPGPGLRALRPRAGGGRAR